MGEMMSTTDQWWDGERAARVRETDPASHVRMTVSERRKFARGVFSWNARLRLGTDVFSADLIDLSAGGARVCSSLVPRLDIELLLEVDKIGVFAARVIRRFSNSFALEFDLSDEQREALEAQLAIASDEQTPEIAA